MQNMRNCLHLLKTLCREFRSVLIVGAVGVLVLAPSIFKGIPRGNDLAHHYRVAIPFYESLGKGELYPGWNSRPGNGYGDTSFRLYPPFFYYLLSACRAITGSWYDGTLLLFTLLSVTGGLGVYFWGRTLLSKEQAMWAGILYLIAPYQVNQLYQASLLGEYAASSILPFAFAFTELVIRRGQARDILGLAISYGLLILTHLPLTVIGSIALLIYALLRMGRDDIRKRVPVLVLAVVLALGASAAYWTTMLDEMSWIRGESINPQAWFDYRNNFLFWKSAEGSTNWWTNMLGAASAMMLLPAVALPRLWKGRLLANPLKALGLLTMLTFVMTLPISEPIWKLFPQLQRVEFPWRWLAVFSMTGSVLVGSTVEHWMSLARSSSRKLLLLASACVILPLALTVSQTIRGATYIARPEFEFFTSRVADLGGVPFWLPKWATKDMPRRSDERVEASHRSVDIESWEPEFRVFQVAAGEATEARVRTFYYPHWTAMADDKRLIVSADTDGAILIPLSEAAQTVTLEFREPARRQWLIYASLIVWGTIVSGFAFFSLRVKSFRRGLETDPVTAYRGA
jgi:hypothetical protein